MAKTEVKRWQLKKIKEPTLSDFQFRLLSALEETPGIWPRELSKILWPDSRGHKRHGKAGPHGSVKGSGMWIAAGCQAGKLENRGWCSRRGHYERNWRTDKRDYIDEGYHLTELGREMLRLEREKRGQESDTAN